MSCFYHLLSDLALSASTFPSYTQTHTYALPVLSLSLFLLPLLTCPSHGRVVKDSLKVEPNYNTAPSGDYGRVVTLFTLMLL